MTSATKSKGRKIGRNKDTCLAYRSREPRILVERQKRHLRRIARLTAYQERRPLEFRGRAARRAS